MTRYLRGEHGPVWNELRLHEALGGDLLEEARAVAKETMSALHAARMYWPSGSQPWGGYRSTASYGQGREPKTGT